MKKHRYILELYEGKDTRHTCPGCQDKKKTFSLYIDTETGKHLPATVGRCNRESNCGYHYTPKQYFQDNNISFDGTEPKAYTPRPVSPQKKPVSFIPFEVFKASLKAHETNNFVKFLIHLFGVEVTSQLVSRYFIATSKLWNGATVFWQIDTRGKIRTGKIMLYSPTTGKRIKEPFDHINWVHKALNITDYKQCLFGEHLLNVDKNKPVAIVESEKTAVIASVYLPRFIWVAVGGLTNLNAEKCSILKGRNVILFPDLKGFEKWSSKAKELSHLTSFQVSDLLERKATDEDKKQGFDIADYLIKFDFREFAPPHPVTSEPTPTVQQCNEVLKTERIEQPKREQIENWTNWTPLNENPESWEQKINELENYFTGIELPARPIKLNQCSTIIDCPKFIESHFATLKANNGDKTFLPHLKRLQELKQVLILNIN